MNIDWSKAPEGYDFHINWTNGEGDFYRDDGDCYSRDGGYYTKKSDLICMPKVVVTRRPWNGEGLPPVGTVCEWRDDDEGRWSKVEVRYLSEHTALLRFQGATGDIEGAFEPNHCQFRPLRTPEQLAAEEREKAIEVMVADIGGYLNHSHTLAAILYDAGYRKAEG